jgi:predicted ArsR family transcriptional regulator
MIAFIRNFFRRKNQGEVVDTAPEASPQKARLLQHLKKNGEIDPLTARDKLGIYRLAARVKDLRDEGHNIVTVNVKLKPGPGRPNARYRLAA